jgi:RAD50-interacting protein 1
LTLTSDNGSPIIKKTLESTRKAIDEVDEEFTKVDQFQTKVNEKIEKYRQVHESIQEHLTKIKDLEHLIEYFKILQDIQDISLELTNCIHSKDEQKIVNLFLSLSGSPESSDSVIGRLQDVDAPHMKLYARRMAFYWHDAIKDKFSR